MQLCTVHISGEKKDLNLTRKTSWTSAANHINNTQTQNKLNIRIKLVIYYTMKSDWSITKLELQIFFLKKRRRKNQHILQTKWKEKKNVEIRNLAKTIFWMEIKESARFLLRNCIFRLFAFQFNFVLTVYENKNKVYKREQIYFVFYGKLFSLYCLIFHANK